MILAPELIQGNCQYGKTISPLVRRFLAGECLSAISAVTQVALELNSRLRQHFVREVIHLGIGEFKDVTG